MDHTYTFIVIDLNPEGTALLSRTLTRKFPGAVIITCAEAVVAIHAMQSHEADAIVVHRPIGMTGEEMVHQLRELRPDIPIIMVSSVDREEDARIAGANTFLLYDEWLMLGSMVADLLQRSSGRTPWPNSSSVRIDTDAHT